MKKPIYRADLFKKEEFWLFVALGLYFVVYSFLVLLRHYSFHSYILDLGNYEQILWNTSHGNLFGISTRPWTTSYLGDHFSPILALPALLYKLFPTTATILILQTALITFSGYLVFLLSGTWGFSKKRGLYFTLIFLTLPALGFVNMFDAHANLFAIPLGLLFLLAFQKKKINHLIIYLLLLLLVKEDLALILAAFGLSLTFEKRQRYLGLFIFFFCLAWFYLAMTILIPSFTVNGVYHYIEQMVGDSSGANSIFSVLQNPRLVLKTLFSPAKISYVLALFGSLFLIPLFAGRFALPILFGLMPILLNRWTSLSTITYHYPASFIAFMLFALMAAIFSIEKKWPLAPPIFLRLILLVQSFIIVFALLGNFSGAKFCKTYFCFAKYSQPRLPQMTQAVRLIPAPASVSASNNLGSHLAQRKTLYIFPRIDNADYILIDKQSIGKWTPYDTENNVFLSLLSNVDYQKIYSQNDIYLFKRK